MIKWLNFDVITLAQFHVDKNNFDGRDVFLRTLILESLIRMNKYM
jgi:hypothetical protein